MAESSADVGERLAEVRRRIGAAGAAPETVAVVGMTKGFPTTAVGQAVAAGLVDLGENYAAELVSKAQAVGDPPLDGAQDSGAPAVRWHFVGAIQRNKVRRLAPHVHLWQSVARYEEGTAIARWAPGAAVLVQVDPYRSAARRNGCSPEATPGLVASLGQLGLDVRGLMVLGGQGPPEEARLGFRTVASLGRRLGAPELSMGMTDDLEVAVQEGATMVRVGRALFGGRPHRPTLGQ